MIDAQDVQILRLLTEDGRMSIHELSEKAGLSHTPVSRRVKKLEASGIITGYEARVDERKLGFTFSAFVSVRLDKQIDETLVAFERQIKLMPEVLDCWLMTGNHDYLLRVVTRDIEEFETFLLRDLTRTEVNGSFCSGKLRYFEGCASHLLTNFSFFNFEICIYELS